MPVNLKFASIAAIVLLMVAGCGQKPAVNPPAEGQGARVPAAEQPAEQSADQNQTLAVKVYYTDDQLNQLVEKEQQISFVKEEDKYLAALKLLTVSPDSESTALAKGFTFHTAELKEQELTVNVSLSPEGRLGAGGEALVLEAIERTLFQFAEVGSINILLDGQAVESLMGHVDLPHPIHRQP